MTYQIDLDWNLIREQRQRFTDAEERKTEIAASAAGQYADLVFDSESFGKTIVELKSMAAQDPETAARRFFWGFETVEALFKILMTVNDAKYRFEAPPQVELQQLEDRTEMIKHLLDEFLGRVRHSASVSGKSQGAQEERSERPQERHGA